MDQQRQRIEALGPAETIIQTLTTSACHIVHNRPGLVTADGTALIGVTWKPVIWKKEGDDKVVYTPQKTGRQTSFVRLGKLADDLSVKDGRKVLGRYMKPGIFPEAAVYYYRKVADVWKMDNEFAAKWASWAFPQEHKDLKVILCAFMLIQSRKGIPVKEDGEILFYDEDYRDVGEAMCLIRGAKDINPKLLLRVGDILNVPGVAEINRELGFGMSARTAPLGRYRLVVEKWLRYREENLPMLEGLVKAGYRTTVMALARRVGYKPTSPKFFEILRWKQHQSKDGRRNVAIGVEVKAAQTWEGLREEQICKKIVSEKPNWKVIVGLLPKSVGMTAAIVSAAVEAGCLSDQDLIILTPTLEEFGLLKDKDVEKRWKEALSNAENQRAAHVARNVRSKETKEALQEAVDVATQKAMEEVTRNLRLYVIVDKSGSMEGALERAKEYVTKFLGAFPLDRTHVSVFNTVGSEIKIKAPKAAAVEAAFAGHHAGGGTHYSTGFQALAKYRPAQDEDALLIFIGDEEGEGGQHLSAVISQSGISPVAFGLLKVKSLNSNGRGDTVRQAAVALGIPCFDINEEIFTGNDPYLVTRNLRHLIASTPVSQARVAQVAPVRKSLVQQILDTELLKKPVWA